MFVSTARRLALPLALLSCALSMDAFAQVDPVRIVDSFLDRFHDGLSVPDAVFNSASYLFWSLATISLVWTMSIMVLRRDFGELFMELLRFIVFTGIFYWLLDMARNRNGDAGFVYQLIDSFTRMGASIMGNNGSLREPAYLIVNTGLDIFRLVTDQMENWADADKLVGATIGLIILMALTLVAAHIVLTLVAAWFLGYGGIFLLGFGGARWTSPIAINYYKHVVAVGASLLALIMVISVGKSFLDEVYSMATGTLSFAALANMLVVSLILAVLSARLPGMIFTLVTGSQLGLLAGTAGMAGTAIMTGGGAALAAATGSHSATTRRDEHRRESVMAAYQHAPSVADGTDTIYRPMDVGSYGKPTGPAHPSAEQGSVFDPRPSATTPWPGPPAGHARQVSSVSSTENAVRTQSASGNVAEAGANRSLPADLPGSNKVAAAASEYAQPGNRATGTDEHGQRPVARTLRGVADTVTAEDSRPVPLSPGGSAEVAAFRDRSPSMDLADIAHREPEALPVHEAGLLPPLDNDPARG